MQFELSKEFLDHFKKAIEDENEDFILELTNELHAADISTILHELNTVNSKYVFSLLGREVCANILKDLDEDVREKFLKTFSPEEIAGFIDFLDSDDAADVLNELSVQQKEETILQIHSEEKVDNIIDLLKYDEDCAGGLMAKELIRANLNWSVDQCFDEIRRQAADVSKIYSIYVVNDKNKLLGRVSLKKLILAKGQVLVSELYDSDVISVETFREEEEVAAMMQKYDLDAIPVVNVQEKLMGRITIDDVIDVITEQAEREKQLMAGISESVELKENIWLLSRARLPWLIIGMFGGILGANFIGLFEGDLIAIPAMAFFIPLITATGGNVGIQSSSVVVQALANKSVFKENFLSDIMKSLGVALINAIIISSLVYGLNMLFLGVTMHASVSKHELSLAVSIALFCVIILASFLGTITPFVLDKLNINPALASGPFITTSNDLLGLGVYFYIAGLLIERI